MLRFLGGTVGTLEVGWNGPWPPPERMTIAHGTDSGIIKVLPEDYDPLLLEQVKSIIITHYKLRNASILEKSDADGVNTMRGAEYVPITND